MKNATVLILALSALVVGWVLGQYVYKGKLPRINVPGDTGTNTGTDTGTDTTTPEEPPLPEERKKTWWEPIDGGKKGILHGVTWSTKPHHYEFRGLWYVAVYPVSNGVLFMSRNGKYKNWKNKGA